MILGCFFDDFRMILGWFWDVFGMIFTCFVFKSFVFKSSHIDNQVTSDKVRERYVLENTAAETESLPAGWIC